MRHELKAELVDILHTLRRVVDDYKSERNKGISATLERIAFDHEETARRIAQALLADEAADIAEEQAGGVDIMSEDKKDSGDVHQSVRYRKTGRITTRIWTAETLAGMTDEARAKVLAA